MLTEFGGKGNAKKIDWIPNGNAPEWASKWSIDAK